MDLTVEVPALPPDVLAAGSPGETLPANREGDPEPCEQEAGEHVRGVVPGQRQGRVGDRDRAPAPEQRDHPAPGGRRHEHSAQRERHGSRRVAAGPAGCVDLPVAQPGREALLGESVLERLRRHPGRHQHGAHRERPPPAAADDRDRDARQAPERVRHRIDEVADRHEAAVDPRPVEPGEAVQDDDVAILHRRDLEGEPADHDQPDGACTGGDEGQRVTTLGHSAGLSPQPRPGAAPQGAPGRADREDRPGPDTPFHTEK